MSTGELVMCRTVLIAVVVVLGGPWSAACQAHDTHMCAPCSLDVCGGALRCLENVCVLPEAPEICANYDPPPTCGGGPACAEGLECFEGECHAPLDVQVGWAHACALWRSGTIACWGYNRWGQAGALDTDAVPAARRVDGIAGAVELTAGIDFSCARLATGEVECWGDNRLNELGNFGSTVPLALQSGPTPQTVALPGPARRIWSAEHRSCARLEDGSLACWGHNLDGCLPVEAVSTNLAEVVATDVGDELALGESHTVWVKNRRVYGFGTNDAGQLGVPSTCTPTDLGYANVTHVAAGTTSTCVVLGGTRVECIGTDRGIDRYEHDRQIVSLVAGRKHTCFVDEAGTVACWGPDKGGVLQTLDYTDDPDGPDAPVVIPGAHGARRLSLGNQFACLVRDGDGTYCWGRPDYGYIGDGVGPHRAPRRMASGAFVALDSGAGHACALAGSGAVTCWGSNESGELGRGFSSKAESAEVLPGLEATGVSTGGGHTCAVDTQGDVYCWGRVYFAETVIATPSPKLLEGLPPARAVSNGWSTVCVLTETLEVYCFGDNRDRQAVPTSTKSFVYAPTHVPEASGALEVVVGIDATCARFPGDRVACWGAVGGLALPEQLALPDGVVVPGLEQMRLGGSTIFLATADGTIRAGGKNGGRLGNGRAARPRGLVDVLGADAALQIDAYYAHACMIQRGEVWCWGLLPAEPLAPRPVLRPEIESAVLVSTGHSASCAFTAAGHVECWGAATGQLGPEDAAHLDPVRVAGLVGRGPSD